MSEGPGGRSRSSKLQERLQRTKTHKRWKGGAGGAPASTTTESSSLTHSTPTSPKSPLSPSSSRETVPSWRQNVMDKTTRSSSGNKILSPRPATKIPKQSPSPYASPPTTSKDAVQSSLSPSSAPKASNQSPLIARSPSFGSSSIKRTGSSGSMSAMSSEYEKILGVGVASASSKPSGSISSKGPPTSIGGSRRSRIEHRKRMMYPTKPVKTATTDGSGPDSEQDAAKQQPTHPPPTQRKEETSASAGRLEIPMALRKQTTASTLDTQQTVSVASSSPKILSPATSPTSTKKELPVPKSAPKAPWLSTSSNSGPKDPPVAPAPVKQQAPWMRQRTSSFDRQNVGPTSTDSSRPMEPQVSPVAPTQQAPWMRQRSPSVERKPVAPTSSDKTEEGKVVAPWMKERLAARQRLRRESPKSQQKASPPPPPPPQPEAPATQVPAWKRGIEKSTIKPVVKPTNSEDVEDVTEEAPPSARKLAPWQRELQKKSTTKSLGSPVRQSAPEVERQQSAGGSGGQERQRGNDHIRSSIDSQEGITQETKKLAPWQIELKKKSSFSVPDAPVSQGPESTVDDENEAENEALAPRATSKNIAPWQKEVGKRPIKPYGKTASQQPPWKKYDMAPTQSGQAVEEPESEDHPVEEAAEEQSVPRWKKSYGQQQKSTIDYSKPVVPTEQLGRKEPPWTKFQKKTVTDDSSENTTPSTGTSSSKNNRNSLRSATSWMKKKDPDPSMDDDSEVATRDSTQTMESQQNEAVEDPLSPKWRGPLGKARVATGGESHDSIRKSQSRDAPSWIRSPSNPEPVAVTDEKRVEDVDSEMAEKPQVQNKPKWQTNRANWQRPQPVADSVQHSKEDERPPSPSSLAPSDEGGRSIPSWQRNVKLKKPGERVMPVWQRKALERAEPEALMEEPETDAAPEPQSHLKQEREPPRVGSVWARVNSFDSASRSSIDGRPLNHESNTAKQPRKTNAAPPPWMKKQQQTSELEEQKEEEKEEEEKEEEELPTETDQSPVAPPTIIASRNKSWRSVAGNEPAVALSPTASKPSTTHALVRQQPPWAKLRTASEMTNDLPSHKPDDNVSEDPVQLSRAGSQPPLLENDQYSLDRGTEIESETNPTATTAQGDNPVSPRDSGLYINTDTPKEETTPRLSARQKWKMRDQGKHIGSFASPSLEGDLGKVGSNEKEGASTKTQSEFQAKLAKARLRSEDGDEQVPSVANSQTKPRSLGDVVARTPKDKNKESLDDQTMGTVDSTASKSLGQMAADSVLITDFRQLNSAHLGGSAEEEGSARSSSLLSGPTDVTPSRADLPSEFQSFGLSIDGSSSSSKPTRSSPRGDFDHQSEQPRGESPTKEKFALSNEALHTLRGTKPPQDGAIDEDGDADSSAVFGVPDSFGTAGGSDVATATPRIADRARAIEQWNGGRSPRPSNAQQSPAEQTHKPHDESESPVEESPNRPEQQQTGTVVDTDDMEYDDPPDIMPIDNFSVGSDLSSIKSSAFKRSKNDEGGSKPSEPKGETATAGSSTGAKSVLQFFQTEEGSVISDQWAERDPDFNEALRGESPSPEPSVPSVAPQIASTHEDSKVVQAWKKASSPPRGTSSPPKSLLRSGQKTGSPQRSAGKRVSFQPPESNVTPKAKPDSRAQEVSPVLVDPDDPFALYSSDPFSAVASPASANTKTSVSVSSDKNSSSVFDPFDGDFEESMEMEDDSFETFDKNGSFFADNSLETSDSNNSSPFKLIPPPRRASKESRARRQREAAVDYSKVAVASDFDPYGDNAFEKSDIVKPSS